MSHLLHVRPSQGFTAELKANANKFLRINRNCRDLARCRCPLPDGSLLNKKPIPLVRRAGARRADPDVLSPDEFRALLAELTAEPYRTMVILAGCLGLARSEFVGLKWADIDWDAEVLSVQRGVVHCHVGNPKTLARRKPIPLAHELLTTLGEHRERSAYAADSDWVFASPCKRGAEPYWPDSALHDFVTTAVERAGITP